MAELNEQKIREMIRSEIRNSNSALRFQQTTIPRHIHNNIDSPSVFQATVTFIGVYEESTNSYAFPLGWNLEIVGTGQYKVTHNLNSQNYIVNANPWATQSATAYIPTIIFGTDYPNAFSIYFANTTPIFVNTSFLFSLVQVDNKSVTPPRYKDVSA